MVILPVVSWFLGSQSYLMMVFFLVWIFTLFFKLFGR